MFSEKLSNTIISINDIHLIQCHGANVLNQIRHIPACVSHTRYATVRENCCVVCLGPDLCTYPQPSLHTPPLKHIRGLLSARCRNLAASRHVAPEISISLSVWGIMKAY